ncbi:hypothetical protein IE81DRAFT_347389 [Ceraceosorus guamensis]|uniref:Uncharacterized protein n=1 Tax=Ceraceosorus guamensis TaxID=1522189 RepID=A0A316VYP6_9BASI|nr:hypothetical protein IE81DRAFT_347389 [Ceraceosorus guamensis]PWN42454.1 hypothetical protein IE81DRAFT_347389 [Ceraceosorus guamensis]
MSAYRYPIVFMATAVATSIVSVVLILVMLVPYQERSINLNVAIPTSTSRYGYGYGGYGGYGTSSDYNTNPYLYSDYSASESTYTTTLGSAYGSAYVQTYTNTRYYYTATSTYGLGPNNAARSIAALAPRATSPAMADALMGRQATTAVSNGASSTSASPSTTPTTISVRQGAPGAILLIVFLVIIAFIFIEATALAAYIGQKSARLIKQEQEDNDEGVRQPLAAAAAGSRGQTPAATEGEGSAAERHSSAASPAAPELQNAQTTTTAGDTAEAARQTATPRSRRYATVKHAKCHFACLLLLAIALLVPLVFIIVTIVYWRSNNDFQYLFTSGAGYNAGLYFSNEYDSTCNSPSGYDSGRYNGNGVLGSTSDICSVAPADALPKNFAYWNGPLVASLVVGIILFGLTLALATLVCMLRDRKSDRAARQAQQAAMASAQAARPFQWQGHSPLFASQNPPPGPPLFMAQVDPRTGQPMWGPRSYFVPPTFAPQAYGPHPSQAPASIPFNQNAAPQQQGYGQLPPTPRHEGMPGQAMEMRDRSVLPSSMPTAMQPSGGYGTQQHQEQAGPSGSRRSEHDQPAETSQQYESRVTQLGKGKGRARQENLDEASAPSGASAQPGERETGSSSDAHLMYQQSAQSDANGVRHGAARAQESPRLPGLDL